MSVTQDPKRTSAAAESKTPNRIWLDGSVLACACPDCQALMSIRLWLMVADCWQCGASVELTQEEQQEAIRLLEGGRLQAAAGASETDGGQRVRPQPPPSAPREPSQPAPGLPCSPPATCHPPPAAHPQPATRQPPLPARIAAAQKPSRARARLDAIRALGETRLWLANWWRDLPCWLTSLVLHMLLMILLGLWAVPSGGPPRPLTLATQVNSLDQSGDAERFFEPDAGPEFDDPGAVMLEPVDEADPFARSESETLVGVALHPSGDEPEPLPSALFPSGPAELPAMLVGRDPRLRSHLVEREGGTIESEAAVARGLQWLARHQDYDGSWDLRGFCLAGDCDRQCRDAAAASDKVSGTALALLPFLGAGQTHLAGEYREVVAGGLDWMVDRQEESGGMPLETLGRMYGHGLGAIVLCEAYGLTRDERLRGPAQRALDFIARAQHPRGGWRYRPGSPGDMSVVGWQIMALRSGEMAYLGIPPDVFDKAAGFLDTVQVRPDRGLFGYLPGNQPTSAMTAEGLLCRQYAGWRADEPALAAGVDWLIQNHLPARGREDIYYWYYGTQVMHHVGGPAWQAWNEALRDLLVSMQETEGHEAGSWSPRRGFDYAGGRLYVTSLSICTLEVYYRHMPLYRTDAVQ
ncbi:MAG: hypothetical protein WD847_17465 [Pirellulales bacterium]